MKMGWNRNFKRGYLWVFLKSILNLFDRQSRKKGWQKPIKNPIWGDS